MPAEIEIESRRNGFLEELSPEDASIDLASCFGGN
jgi:hypothetical protein